MLNRDYNNCMKILYLNNLLNGGAANSIRMVAKGAIEKGHTPVLIVSADSSSTSIVDGYTVHHVKTPNLYGIVGTRNQAKWKKPIWHLLDSYNIFSKHSLKKIILAEKPDIIHTNNYSGFSPYIWKLADKLGIPVVHTIQDYSLVCTRAIMFKNSLCLKQCAACKLYSIPKKHLSRYVQAVVGVSNIILQTHLKLGFFKHASIKTNIHNPISLTIHTLNKTTQTPLKFGFVGLLAPIKGTDCLLEVFSKHFKSGATLHLWGKGYTSEFENMIKEKYKQENIIFEGYGNHDEIYKKVDVLIVPAMWHEPFGLIIPEANSFGVPVIASQRGAFTETVTDGKNGFLFNPDQPESLVEKIQYFIDHPEIISSMETNCLAFAKTCSYETISNQYLEIYKQILN